jgi:putative membrane protein
MRLAAVDEGRTGGPAMDQRTSSVDRYDVLVAAEWAEVRKQPVDEVLETRRTTMTWHRGHGLDWGGCIVTVPVMVVFWAAVITAIVIAIRYLISERRDPAATTASGSTGAEHVLAERFARGGIYDDEFHRRLM